MARGINKVILLGHLGRDPEVKYMPNGNAVANVTLATSEIWKDKNSGQQQERTEWHRVVIFGKLAEIAGQYLKKGSLVYFEGQLQTRKWQDQSGQDRYATEVVVNQQGTMQMLDRKTAPGENGDYTFDQDRPGDGGRQPTLQQQQNNLQPDEFDNDIPF